MDASGVCINIHNSQYTTSNRVQNRQFRKNTRKLLLTILENMFGWKSLFGILSILFAATSNFAISARTCICSNGTSKVNDSL